MRSTCALAWHPAAVAAPASDTTEVGGVAAAGVVDGAALLAAVARGEVVPAGAHVVVVGASLVALECARVLAAQGRAVALALPCGRAELPGALPKLDARIIVDEWVLPAEIITRSGRARWIRLERARPGAPDARGRRSPGADLVLPADLVVLARGERVAPCDPARGSARV
jgi:NADPH-dependent glutamate synthase beta subunit-like oxidoreductase